MKTLILIFIVAAFSCTQETKQNSLLNVSAEVWSDTILNDDNLMVYYGEWTHMNNPQSDGSIQTGSYPNNDESYVFCGDDIAGVWMFGFDIYTELSDGHEAYIVEVDGIDIDTVNVKDSRNSANHLTYSVRFEQRENYQRKNYKIRLRRYGGYFVLNKIVRWGDHIPGGTIPPIDPPIDCIPDTVYSVKIDTIYLPLDTLIVVQPEITIEFKDGEITYKLK